MSAELLDEVRSLLLSAASAYAADGPEAAEFTAARERLDGPLTVAFAGKVKAGKSTLLNALVGERLAPTDAGECTRIVSLYQQGITYRVQAQLQDGSRRPLRFSRDDGALEIALGQISPAEVDRLIIEWPSASLTGMTLIDTPGIASLTADASQRATRYLVPDDERATEADAVVYLMRHLHAADRRFLEAFHDQDLSQATPVNTVAVLSRADEIGVGRLDAMTSARKIARRYSADPQIRRLCQTVIPVAGLIAEAAATLRQDEFQAFSTLAAARRERVDALLISVDRFVSLDDGCGLLPIERQHLLMRFGLYGVRLSVALIRQGVVETAAELSAQLSKRSGLDDLRRLLDTLFTDRRSVLKARAGLLDARSIIQRYGDRSGLLEPELERISSNAHEIVELRLLNALRSGGVSFEPSLAEQIEQAAGASGTQPRDRLGLEPGADAEMQRERAFALIGAWRATESHPMTTRDQREALGVAIHSLERILSRLDAAG